jgi:translation initiation factor 2B subunit (eIF-2B alpha/beta/delta family)
LNAKGRIESIVELIRNDSERGATDLVQDAVFAVKTLGEANHRSRSALMEGLLKLLGELVEAQPSMAQFRTLANGLLLAVEETEGVKAARDGILKGCEGYMTALHRSRRNVAQEASALIGDGMVVLTHSSSTHVLSALQDAWKSGIRFNVICTESRPKLEGAALAETLAAQGIRTRLVSDSAGLSLLCKADLLLLGADTVMMDGVVNKVGTRGLCIVSKEEGVPAYVLAGREKFLPPDLERGFLIEEKDPREILGDREGRIEALNVYFDLTPFSYLSDLVTESGRTGAREVRSRLLSAKVSPLMRRVLTR